MNQVLRGPVLIYTHEFYPHFGGAGKYSAVLARELAALGQRVIVLAPRYGEMDAEWDRTQPYEIRRFHLTAGLKGYLRAAFRFLRTYRELDPGATFVTEADAQIPVAFATFVAPLRYAVTVHGSEIVWYLADPSRTGRVLGRIIPRLYTRAQAVICGSRAIRGLLLRYLPRSNPVVIRYGLDLGEWQLSTPDQIQKLRTQYGLEGKVLLTVARLIPEKGHELVLEALEKLVVQAPTLKYLIVGSGPYRPRLEQRVAELGLQENVIFCGRVTDRELGGYYAVCDVFVMPGRAGGRVEGFGLVYAEAACFGKPVIAGNTGGVPEFVTDGYNGRLLDDVNAASVEAAIRELLDSDLAEQMGARGRERVRKEFQADRMARDSLAVFEGMAVTSARVAPDAVRSARPPEWSFDAHSHPDDNLSE